MANTIFDAIGPGISGGWAAKELKSTGLSSWFAYDDGHIVDTVAISMRKLPGTRIYLDCGDLDLDKYFLTSNNRMKQLLDKKHPEIKLMYRVFPGATHNEYAWAKRLDIPFTFLFGTQK